MNDPVSAVVILLAAGVPFVAAPLAGIVLFAHSLNPLWLALCAPWLLLKD